MPEPDDKATLRRTMRQRLAAHAAEDRRTRSERLIRRLQALPEWKAARFVMLFSPLPAEPDLDPLWSGGGLEEKRCAYPRTDGERLAFYEVTDLSQLHAGRWSLREPEAASDRERTLSDADLILVPGLAFTRSGRRLGRGGGYYDRALAGAAPFKLGVAFDFQVVDVLPTAAHDVRVDRVLTDAG